MKKIVTLIIAMTFSFAVMAEEKKTANKEITLSADNTVILNQDFNSESVSIVMQQIMKIDSDLPNGYPIYLFLDTPGGSIQAGLELFEFVKGLNRPVHTITLFAASMGFQAVQNLGERLIVGNGVLMSHKAKGGFTGEFGGGLSQLDSRYGLWLRRIDELDKITVDRTNGKQTLQSYRSAYENELWLTGKDAVEQGYADAVVNVKCDASLREGRHSVNYDAFLFTLTVEYSNCPMNTAPLSITVNIQTNKGNMSLNDFIKNNGQFGPECTKTESSGSYYYNSDEETKTRKEKTCAANSKLTMEEIEKKISEVKESLTKSRRENIIRSY
jgi:ATP-dependent Clp protease protease subunit